MSTFTYHKPGIGNAASYQVSGIPWHTSSVIPGTGDIITISFPRVTKTVIIKNNNTVSSAIRIAFDPQQIKYQTGEHFDLPEGESISLDFKMVDIHFQSQGSVDIPISVVAGLTNIERSEFPPQLVISEIKLLTEQEQILTTESDSNIILE